MKDLFNEKEDACIVMRKNGEIKVYVPKEQEAEGEFMPDNAVLASALALRLTEDEFKANLRGFLNNMLKKI